MSDEDDRAPIDRLDEAVQAYVNSLPDYAGQVVTGWALGFQVADSTDEPGMTGMTWATDYTTGPATNPATGVGIAALAVAQMKRDLLGDDDGE